VLRFERDGVDPRKGGKLPLAVEAELGREWIERSLGRIALDLPRALLLEQLRIVAEQGDAPISASTGSLSAGLPSLLISPSGA
jgi:hypothetical protein